ncbi:MAG: UDP-glucose/GDP-mannose dehydrogenase family protein [Candidatus Magasanikbacteria bacterium]|nr:UDP-glucose/GDP-mannose dehydrogenase family protein [Candidatus Magasanikbacteria bacterium]
MNILYIGAGFVGACSAAVSADSGHTTLVYDIDPNKIQKLASFDRDTIESCLFEKGLGDLLIRNKERIRFTTDYQEVISFVDSAHAIFMCLPTPEVGETGESNLTYYNAAAKELSLALAKRNGGAQSQYVVIVNKSTVPIAMVDETAAIMNAAGVKNYGVVSNPEFLVEGNAVRDSLKPNRIVIGAWTAQDFAIMKNVYQRFVSSPDVTYIEVNPKEAAAGKLLANFYLFNRVAVCFDVIGRTAEAFDGIQYENLRSILTSDERIGSWGFYDSLYAGGSCFIKDARSLSHQLTEAGKNPAMVNETYAANKRQLALFMQRAKTEADISWQGKRVALLGVAFKRDTNDIRNSPSINIVETLLKENVAHISVYDPTGKEFFANLFPQSEHVAYVSQEHEAISNCDVVIISTDWPQFRGVGDVILSQSFKPLIMDGRRMLQHRYAELQEAGCAIIAVGSTFLPAKQ